MAEAKELAITAQTTANSAVESAGENAKELASQANALSDAKKAIDSDVASAKGLANAAQATADNAIKSASSVANDLSVVASQAKSNANEITKVTSDVGSLQTTVADTANALSDAKTAFSSDVTEAKNLASTAQTTADNAVKSASSVADDLTAVASQAKANANGITKVTSDVGLLQTTVANNTGDISTIQETAKQIQQSVSDNAGNITVAKQTADSAVAVASDAKSNATVAIQTASQASITAKNSSDQAASAVITANGAMTTASDAKINATVAVQTASGASLTATNANSDATVAKQTASEAKVQASNAESDFAQLSIRANKIEANVADNSGAIASVQQTANGLTTTVGKVDDRVKTIEDKTNWTTKTGPLDMNTLTTTQNIYYRDSNLNNADGETGWAYIQVVSTGERVTQTVWHDRSSIQHTRTGAIDGSTYDWDAWNTVATNAQVVQVKQTVDGIATTINDPKTGLNATYQTASGNSTTISNVKSDVSQLSIRANKIEANVSDNSGNISKIQETATQIQQAVSDNSGAIVVAKQTADSAVAVASDAKSNATVAVQTASGASVTAKNAQGDATTAMTTANSAVIQASDAKSNATVAVQTASEASLTAANAKGDASIAKQTASDASVQIKNAQGDISKLQTRAGAIETSVANNSGAIADVQATANQLKASVSDNAGNITIAKQTADSAVTVASDAKSNATVASQTASQASITAQNASGQAASAVLTANGAMTTASDAKSDATVAIQTASGASLTATNAQGDASIAKQTASEAKVQASNAESDFAQLSVRANKIETNVANNSGAIASVQQTANGLTTTVGNVDNRVKTIEDKTNWTTKTGPLDMNTLTTTQNIYYRDSNLNNADGETGWAYIQVVSMGERVTQTVWHDRSSIQHTRTGAASGSSYNWDAWNTVATNAQVVQVKNTVDGISTTINDPKTGLNATYQTAAGNATTISNVKSDVYQLQTTANGLTSRVGNLESKTNTQETAIEQNKNAIALKADQTAVDKINGTVSQLQSSLTVQAGQIQEKVTSSQVTGMLAGYATQDYAQSLVTQQAGTISESITKLEQTVKQGAENNVQLVRKSDFEDGDKGGWDAQTVVITDPPAELGQSGMKVLQTNSRDAYEDDVWYSVKPGEKFDVDFWCKPSTTYYSQLGLIFDDKDYNNPNWYGVATDQSGQWKHYIGTITAPANASFAKPWFQMNKDGSNTTDTALLAKPSIRRQNATTVAAIQQITTSIDGLQSNVTNLKNDTSSQITQLSNLISTKVSSDDFNNLSKTVELQTLDSADINNMKTNGHYFVHNLANNPIGGWVYVDVTGNGNDRIRQDVYQDSGSGHKYRRLFGTSWTGWEEGATESQITQLSDAINLRVKSADLISQINLQAGTSLIQSNKLVLDGKTTIITGEAFIPSAAISSISADKIMLGSSSLWNTDGTLNLVNQNGNLKALIQVKQGLVQDTTQSIISFSSDYNNRAFSVTPVGATITPTLFFERYDQTEGHWLGFTRNEVRRDGLMFHTWDDEGERFFVGCHARFDRNISAVGTINQGTWNGTTGKPLAGILTITAGNTIWSGSDFLAIGDHLSNSFTNVMARSFSQQSTLSSKTNIETVDPKDALDLVNRTDIRSYQYKTDVEQGKTKRYTSLIIDDVNDVSQYYAPNEFTNEERTGRDDGSAVGYLFLAVKELTRRIKNLEEKLNG